MNYFKIICASALVLTLSGCYFPNYDPYSSLDTDPITGKWQDKAGMISTFNNGNFETYTPDTNEKLSEGSYKIDEIDPSVVTMKLKSLVKGTISQINCNINNYHTKLYCTSIPKIDTNIQPKSFQLSRVN